MDTYYYKNKRYDVENDKFLDFLKDNFEPFNLKVYFEENRIGRKGQFFDEDPKFIDKSKLIRVSELYQIESLKNENKLLKEEILKLKEKLEENIEYVNIHPEVHK